MTRMVNRFLWSDFPISDMVALERTKHMKGFKYAKLYIEDKYLLGSARYACSVLGLEIPGNESLKEGIRLLDESDKQNFESFAMRSGVH